MTTQIVIGAGRGATLMTNAIIPFRKTTAAPVATVYVDPQPGKAALLAALLERHDLPASSREERIETLLEREGFPDDALLLVHVDRPSTLGHLLATTSTSPYSVLAYHFVRTRDQLFGFALALRGDETATKAATGAFFSTLGEYAARSGADALFGRDGRPVDLLAEAAYRERFSEHCGSCLRKLAIGLDPEYPPFVASTNGTDLLPVHLVDRTSGWGNPLELAQAVLAGPTTPMAPGTDFLIAETGPPRDGVRLHHARYRVDARVSVRGSVALDETSDALARERQREEARRALELAQRHQIRRTSPVFTSD